jgi:hypothetical protein
MRLDALKSRELQATIYALRSVDKTIQKQVRVHTKNVAGREWKQALAERADTRLQQRVIVDTAVVSVSNQNVRVQAAKKGRVLRGGLNPKTDYAPVEFGAQLKKITYDRRGRNGGTHRVTRSSGSQFPRHRGKTGYVFWPAAREMVPRIGSLWVQTTVRTIANALEGKQE